MRQIFQHKKKLTELYFTLPTVNHENKTKCTKKIAVRNYAKKLFLHFKNFIAKRKRRRGDFP